MLHSTFLYFLHPVGFLICYQQNESPIWCRFECEWELEHIFLVLNNILRIHLIWALPSQNCVSELFCSQASWLVFASQYTIHFFNCTFILQHTVETMSFTVRDKNSLNRFIVELNFFNLHTTSHNENIKQERILNHLCMYFIYTDISLAVQI